MIGCQVYSYVTNQLPMIQLLRVHLAHCVRKWVIGAHSHAARNCSIACSRATFATRAAPAQQTMRLLGRPRGRRVSRRTPRGRIRLRRRVCLCAARYTLLVSVLLGDRITVHVDTVCSCGRCRSTGAWNRGRRDGRCRRRARRRHWRNSGNRRRRQW